jgi:CubicO group peptidase (beta-lactamase class C family)
MALGMQDLEGRRPMTPDTIFRIASMTKPVTSVAVMMLYEEGHFLLSDPISRFIPAFKEMKVLVRDKDATAPPRLVPAEREITIRDLLTHRSGISYGFIEGPVGEEYRRLGVSDGLEGSPLVLEESVGRLAGAPLVSHPGREWHYGLSVDVLGRLVEVVARMRLDEFFAQRILRPLRMDDTAFAVSDDKRSRFAVAYAPREGGGIRPMDDPEKSRLVVFAPWKAYRGGSQYLSGGAGLVSTARDYARFLEMLRRGGELDGVRLLAPKTVELMTVSHGRDLPHAVGDDGTDFGLGFSVVIDLGATQNEGSAGAYGWGGIYGTSFWVDPKERIVGVLMAQRFPSSGLGWADQFQALAYQALVEP